METKMIQNAIPEQEKRPQDQDGKLLKQQCERIREKFHPWLKLFSPMSTDVYKDFSILPEAQRKASFQVLDFMEHLVDVSITEKINPLRDQQLTWYAMGKLGLKIPSNLFSWISDTDCVEIYTDQGIQLYRNFHFFQFSSYSLEDHLTYPYFELYKRPQWLEEEMGKMVALCFQHIEEPLPISVPDHVCVETRSQGSYEGHVHFKKICGLKPTPDYNAFLVTQSVTRKKSEI